MNGINNFMLDVLLLGLYFIFLLFVFVFFPFQIMLKKIFTFLKKKNSFLVDGDITALENLLMEKLFFREKPIA